MRFRTAAVFTLIAALAQAAVTFVFADGLESEQASEQLEDLDEAPDTARVCEPMKDR